MRQRKKLLRDGERYFKKTFLYPTVLIDRDNIPDSYFALQIKLAKERGQGGDLNMNGLRDVGDISREKRREAGELYL